MLWNQIEPGPSTGTTCCYRVDPSSAAHQQQAPVARRTYRDVAIAGGAGDLGLSIAAGLLVLAMLTLLWIMPAHAETPAGQGGLATPEKTVFLEDDNLAVTVASATMLESDPLDSEFNIWVGQIELSGRSAIWVELIDRYGEVIYDSEVGPNETHLLPDGRAIVVRSVDPRTRIAKMDESRLPMDGATIVTRRVVEDETFGTTSVEFIETKPEAAAPETKQTPLMHLASFGAAVWQKLAALVSGAADRMQIAWNWLIDTLHA